MLQLEDIVEDTCLKGILPNQTVTVVKVEPISSEAIQLYFKDASGNLSDCLLYQRNVSQLEITEEGRSWSLDGDGRMFRLMSEALRIKLAHMFDPLLAIHTSLIEPLPHQITAVYEKMLNRHPLRFLLADDPGAGKTIMAGLLIKELIVRGDLQRCLIVCPGSLAEQWQDEMYKKFQLSFNLMTTESINSSRGNYFVENDLVIARLDKLSRNPELQEFLEPDDARWDLVVCDEAHKMSARAYGKKITQTKRYQLGMKLSHLTHHFLLVTATPHSGKEKDFQLFLALIDEDRFEGLYREGVHISDSSDIMRRMIKEDLVKFDAKPLFPERIANTISYQLTSDELELYESVTAYVREEFNRADKLNDNKQAGNIGFALTILQRRLASSPAAIYKSINRRRVRLEQRLNETEKIQRSDPSNELPNSNLQFDLEDLENIDDLPSQELEKVEDHISIQSTTAHTVEELNAEIEKLKQLEIQADQVRKSGTDKKWLELADLLNNQFSLERGKSDDSTKLKSKENTNASIESTTNPKLIIFTEHRDTLEYLVDRIKKLLGTNDSVVSIHGGIKRDVRREIQESFMNDRNVKILVATDAAGEGINLQRAQFMVNYDLPWNPNRLEQRFGRIHRIGQKNTCYLWNLVAGDTREGDVYYRLLQKLEHASESLGGKVFDVLGKIQFKGKTLKDLLIEAIRSNKLPNQTDHFEKVIDGALDIEKIKELIECNVLSTELMDTSKVQKVREEMERADARRLQPHFIESFFLEAFKELGGIIREREQRRYEISKVPDLIRRNIRKFGNLTPVLPRYERIVFEKELITLNDYPLGTFVCPGHPLLDATTNIILEKNQNLLRQGTILVDENDHDFIPRLIFYLQHEIRDGRQTKSGSQHLVSKRMLYVEADSNGNIKPVNFAPYLDFRPLKDEEPSVSELLQLPELSWINRDIEKDVKSCAATQICLNHLEEVKTNRLPLIEKTKNAVQERLRKEIDTLEDRANELKIQEKFGQITGRSNSTNTLRKAKELRDRLEIRLNELDLQESIVSSSPNLIGGFLVIPIGLIAKASPKIQIESVPTDTHESARRAREIVMAKEQELGYIPVDREFEKLGYDIESKVPNSGRLRFIEVKGRIKNAKTITVTKNEILCSLNKPDDYILAIVEFINDDIENKYNIYYIRKPFNREPDFGVTSVNYNFAELIKKGEDPW